MGNFKIPMYFSKQLDMESTDQKKTLIEKLLPFIKLFWSAFFMLIALRLILAIIIAVSGAKPQQPYLDDYSTSELLFYGLIKAPLIESIIIVALLWLFTRFTSRRIAMIGTAIIFGVLHLAPGVNFMVVFISASIGYLFIYLYYKARSKGLSGYWLIVVIHSLDNALSLIPEIIQFFS